MSSAAESVSLSALLDRLMAMPLFASITATRSDPEHDSDNRQHPDRLIIINPVTQAMMVIGTRNGFESFLNDLTTRKDGQPPASQTAIDGLESVEIKCTDGEEIEKLGLGGGECVICLEEWRVGDVAKEMPCKHKFHGGCVEKWLKIRGTCPVCRYKMECDDDVEKKNRDVESDQGRVRRELWVTVDFGNNVRSTTPTSEEES